MSLRELVNVARPLGPRGMLVSRWTQPNRLKYRAFERRIRDGEHTARIDFEDDALLVWRRS
jgi:hypothetical protein